MTDINLFPLFLSFKVAATATFFSILLGLPVAYYLSRSDHGLADLIDTILTLPVVFPPTVLGYYLLVLLGRQSRIGKFLEEQFDIMIVFTPAGAIVAALVVSIPFLVKSARAAFSGINPDILNAAKLLGRGEFYIFFSICTPLAWRGIAAGIIIAFARALGDFGATLMVAGNIPGQTLTMPIAIYDAMLAGNKGLTNKLVTIMTVTAVIFLFLLNRLEKRMAKGGR